MENVLCNIQVLRGLDTNRSLLSHEKDGNGVDLWYEDDVSGRQRWRIKALEGYKDVYHILTSGEEDKYLSTTEDGDRVDLHHKDDGSGRQRWHLKRLVFSNIPDYYNIMCLAGVKDDKKFLSCSSDGLHVDLLKGDDGTGRQRWQIQAFQLEETTEK